MKASLIIRITSLATIIVLLCISCQTILEVDQLSYDVSSNGLETVISLDVNNDWTAFSSDSWCLLNPMSGDKNTKQITMMILRNTRYVDRECDITISSKDKSETITVKQHQQDAIEVETSSISISDAEQDFTLSASANVDYNVSVSGNWIQHIGTKAMNTQTLTFHAKENTNADPRYCSIRLEQSGGIVSTVIVNQKQRDYITLSKDNIDLGWTGASGRISVYSNVDYEMSVDNGGEWLHVERNGSGRNCTLSITADDYEPTPETHPGTIVNDRSATITLRYGTLLKTISVTQRFRDYIWLSDSSVKLYLGYRKTVTARAFFHEGINTNLVWSSSNEDVASVNDGVISGKTRGTALIYVKSQDDKYSSQLSATVKEAIDDIYVSASGKNIDQSGWQTILIFHSNIHWPSEVGNIKFYSVWLCYPDGTAYDIKGTSSGYVEFRPVYKSGALSDSDFDYYSTWYVMYQCEIDGVYHEFRANVNAHTWGWTP